MRISEEVVTGQELTLEIVYQNITFGLLWNETCCRFAIISSIVPSLLPASLSQDLLATVFIPTNRTGFNFYIIGKLLKGG